jgi:hypothetical protein
MLIRPCFLDDFSLKFLIVGSIYWLDSGKNELLQRAWTVPGRGGGVLPEWKFLSPEYGFK